MPCSLQQLSVLDLGYGTTGEESAKSSVDIVAVHGLHENLFGAWTDEETGILWLRDLLPKATPIARVLTFGYDASAASFYGAGCAETIQSHAHTLITALQGDRSLDGCEQRPIIFICHGLGGILVKNALAYSKSRTSEMVAHLHSIYISTFGILFFGTPHICADVDGWLSLEASRFSGHISSSELKVDTSLSRSSTTLATITDQFAPLMKNFHIFFFWEEVPTTIEDWTGFIVDSSSAAPIVDNTERSGIDATHSGMVKFSKSSSSSYRTVIAAVKRYASEAPKVITHRWECAEEALATIRSNEAYELLEGSLHVRREVSSSRSRSRPRSHSEGRWPKHLFLPPQSTTNFIGRQDISQIISDAFSEQERKDEQRRFVVYGIGGSGKTQLCSKFAKDNQHCYFAIFTIHASSIDAAKESFAQIGKIGHLGETETAGKFWLSQLRQPWLLIIDNADDPDLDLEWLFPNCDWGDILITTRNPDFRKHSNVGKVELSGLKEDEALQLLLGEADLPRPWDESTQATGNMISRTLGYLAIALKQAGTSIFKKMCSLQEYLVFYDHIREERRTRLLSDIPRKQNDDIYSTFDVSIRYLYAKNTIISQDSIELLNMIGFYHFEHIRVDIFTKAIENRLKTLTISDETSRSSRIIGGAMPWLRGSPALPSFLRNDRTAINPYRVRQAIHELYSLSLISFEGKDASFSVHPLVHAWAKARLSTRSRSRWAQIALNTLTESILLPPQDSGELFGQFRRDLLPHLDACLAASPITLPDYSTHLGKIHLILASFLMQSTITNIRIQATNAAKCGYVYADRGRFEKATKYLLITKNALVQTVGYEHEKTMMAMLGLAGTYWGLGRLEEGILLQKRVVEARTKVFGPKDRQTLKAMSQLGLSYWLYGQYKEALQLQQLTTEHMQEVLGLDDDDTLASMDNFGVTLGSWHRYQESLKMHEKVLLAREKRLGVKDLDTLTTMNNVAMALLSLKRFEEAREIMQKVFDERKLQLGKEHPWTLWALCNLAKIKIELGLLQEAEFLLIDGIAAGKRSLSDDHLGVLMGVGELGRVYARQGRLEESEKLGVELFHKLEKSRGPEHPDTVFALWKLGVLYGMQGEATKGIRSCELALEKAVVRLTKEHPWYRQINDQLRLLREQEQKDTREKLDVSKPTDLTVDVAEVSKSFKLMGQKTW